MVHMGDKARYVVETRTNRGTGIERRADGNAVQTSVARDENALDPVDVATTLTRTVGTITIIFRHSDLLRAADAIYLRKLRANNIKFDSEKRYYREFNQYRPPNPEGFGLNGDNGRMQGPPISACTG
ncbi:hypothetical protein DPV78_003237 [Talaromyces pinophilus]|nr:hypothetical protein DPV78_003237 [Talaromyces pinophilus]